MHRGCYGLEDGGLAAFWASRAGAIIDRGSALARREVARPRYPLRQTSLDPTAIFRHSVAARCALSRSP